MPWECEACTWRNDESNADCSMCQTKRPRNYLSPNNSARRDEEAASVVCRQTKIIENVSAAPTEEKASSSLATNNQNRGDNRIESTEWDDSTRLKPSQSNRQKCTIKNDTKQSSSKKWDAFASLENNYESSDSSGDESEESGDSDSDGSYDSDIDDGCNQQQDDVKVGDKPQWDAFKSLQETLSDDDSSSISGSDEESSDCIMLPDEEDKKMPPTKTATKNNLKSECVDLVDTDEDDEEEVKDKKPKRVKTRKQRNRSSNSKAIALDDSDSSYLSEVESSRPLPSSASRQKRSIPPWQLSARSETKSSSILQNDSILPRGSFSCLNGRNDIGGINNETRTSAPVLAPAATTRQRKTSTKSGSRRRRKRSNSSTDAAAPAKKKRRTRKYKRSSRRGGRGGRGGAAAASSSRRNNNNAWSARERGIRQPIGSGYMNITKQEPMLQNIGGASIQF